MLRKQHRQLDRNTLDTFIGPQYRPIEANGQQGTAPPGFPTPTVRIFRNMTHILIAGRFVLRGPSASTTIARTYTMAAWNPVRIRNSRAAVTGRNT